MKIMTKKGKNKFIVSAIISVYNCEKYIFHCLKDLEDQTIAKNLEIIIINSGSEENEELIIKKYINKYKNIKYIKTENRETIYQSWNRAIKIASGRYITNANADDRHRKDAYEIMVNELDNNDKIDLVYANDLVTNSDNVDFENIKVIGYSRWNDFDETELLNKCYIGPHPMWRKSLHDRYGNFSENYKIAGDYEFWLRVSNGSTFKHINEYLGVYLFNPKSIENRNKIETFLESERVISNYIFRRKNRDDKISKILKFHAKRNLYIGQYYLNINKIELAKESFNRSLRYDMFNLKNLLIILYILLKKYSNGKNKYNNTRL